MGEVPTNNVRLCDDQAGALKPDALTPAQIEAKAESLAVTKAALPPDRCFVLALLAGAFIAFGGMFFGLVLGDPTLPFIVTRVLGGLCFCLGLVLVLCCGAELFTGNSLMVCGAMNGKVTWGAMLKNWAVVWVGNLLGAVLAAGLAYLANLQGMNGGAVGDAIVSVAASKASLAPTALVAKGVLCNMLVCLAVWMSFGARSVVDKFVCVLFPIAGFVAMGFEHCVANMFFLSMGLMCKAAGFGASAASLDALDLGGMFYNLALSSLGNVIGGAVLVALSYWFAYGRASGK